MSLTLGHPQRPSWVFFVGGTGSALEHDAIRVYGGDAGIESLAHAVWPDRRGLISPRVVEWPGGFPFDYGPVHDDPRKVGLNELRREVRAVAKAEVTDFAFVGFSHGGWIVMRMVAEMLDAAAWRGATIRLLTVSVPPLRSQRQTARKIGESGRVNWLGIREDSDPIIHGWSGIIERLEAGDGPFGVETEYLVLPTPLDGLAAHDRFPGCNELRGAVTVHYGRGHATDHA